MLILLPLGVGGVIVPVSDIISDVGLEAKLGEFVRVLVGVATGVDWLLVLEYMESR